MLQNYSSTVHRTTDKVKERRCS